MEIKLIRQYYQKKYTIGRLYVNNYFFSDTLEPPSKRLSEKCSLKTIKKVKGEGFRAIPQGGIAFSSLVVNDSDDGCRYC